MSLWAASKLQLHYRQRNMNCFSFLNSGTSRVGKFKKFEIKSKITMYDSAGEPKPKENIKEKQSISVRFQRVILGGLEQFFYKYGKFVAR